MLTALRRESLVLGLVLAASPVSPAQATMGAAEWEISTPGGNTICSRDPIKAEHGVALVAKDGETVLISHLETWRLHKGYIAGKDADGYFLYREADGHIDRLRTIQLLNGLITQRKIGRATSRWMTPDDGWKLAQKRVH